MLRVRTVTLERDGTSIREIVLLVVAVAVVGAVSILVLLRGGADFPAGRIGFHEGRDERWVNARGETMDAPEDWSARPASEEPSAVPALGAEQVVSPDGGAIAYVSVAGEGAWSVSRLMVKEGERVTEIGLLGGGDWPPLVLGTKAGARSVDGVPLVIEWSPDGSQLAWGSVMEPPYNLHLADRGSWKTRSLPLEGGYAGELAWAPGGRHLAISTYADDRTDHTILMLDMASGEPPKRVAKGCVMVWSPDGWHLALHGEPRTQPGLWVVSVDGGARQVIDRLGVAPFAWVE